MQESASFTNNMDTLFSDLQNFVKTDSVLGSPMSVGDKTLVPVMSVTLGYGGSSKSSMGNQVTQGNAQLSNPVGLGARIHTNAVILIEKDKVQMMPVSQTNNMQQIIDKIPQTLTSMSQNIMGMSSSKQSTSNNQNTGSNQTSQNQTGNNRTQQK